MADVLAGIRREVSEILIFVVDHLTHYIASVMTGRTDVVVFVHFLVLPYVGFSASHVIVILALASFTNINDAIQFFV